MLADIAHGHVDGADVCFLLAVIVFAVAAIIWVAQVSRTTVHAQAAHAAHAAVAVGLALVSLGWLLL